MLQQFKSKPRTQKLLARLGDKVESLMDSNEPEAGESYEDWMTRVGAIYKESQPKAEAPKVRQLQQLEPRGTFEKNGKQYFEYVRWGQLYTKEILEDRDQYKG